MLNLANRQFHDLNLSILCFPSMQTPLVDEVQPVCGVVHSVKIINPINSGGEFVINDLKVDECPTVEVLKSVKNVPSILKVVTPSYSWSSGERQAREDLYR